MSTLTTPQTISVGQFVVVPTGESEFSVKTVLVETVLQFSIISIGSRCYARETAIAAFDTKEEAERLVSTIAGIGEQYQQAVQAAHGVARQRIERAVLNALSDGETK